MQTEECVTTADAVTQIPSRNMTTGQNILLLLLWFLYPAPESL